MSSAVNDGVHLDVSLRGGRRCSCVSDISSLAFLVRAYTIRARPTSVSYLWCLPIRQHAAHMRAGAEYTQPLSPVGAVVLREAVDDRGGVNGTRRGDDRHARLWQHGDGVRD